MDNFEVEHSTSFAVKKEYNLYDFVYIKDGLTPTLEKSVVNYGGIERIIDIYKQKGGESMAVIARFFRPCELRGIVDFIDPPPTWKEIFVACGTDSTIETELRYMGKKIEKKASILCTSKDRRNPQPSEAEVKSCEYYFYRIYDLDNKTFSEEFPPVMLNGHRVEDFFNKPKKGKGPAEDRGAGAGPELVERKRARSRLVDKGSASAPPGDKRARGGPADKGGASASRTSITGHSIEGRKGASTADDNQPIRRRPGHWYCQCINGCQPEECDCQIAGFYCNGCNCRTCGNIYLNRRAKFEDFVNKVKKFEGGR